MRRRAFSLLEIVIALPLAMTVLLVATVAFRTASKTASAARALADENAALIAGYEAGMNEVDYWFCLDDPADAAGQQLRRAWSIRRQNGNPGDWNSPPAWTTASVAGDPGNDGYAGQPFVRLDLPAEYWNTAVWDGRWWPRSDYSRTPDRGNKSCFSWIRAVAHIRHPNAEARWLPWMMDRSFWSLGLGGSMAYTVGCMPVHWELAFDNGTAGAGRRWNSYARAVADSGGAWGAGELNWTAPMQLATGMRATSNWGMYWEDQKHFLWGRRSLLGNGLMYLLAPRDECTFDPERGSGADLRKDTCAWRSFLPADLNGIERALDDATAGDRDNSGTLAGVGADRVPNPESQGAVIAGPQQIRLAPDGLPRLRVGISRSFQALPGFTAMVIVQVLNPTTGTSRELRFWADGTSLRGARQQRAWPHWGGSPGAALDRVRSPALAPVTAVRE